jgi:small subunit ribosomal protein S16
MALKIRLRRMGRKKAPHYRIVVAESSMPRDGRFVATVGHYNPRTEPMTLVVDRDEARRWIGNGAKPTETVDRLFNKAGIYSDAPVIETPAPVVGVAQKAAAAVASAAGTVRDAAASAVEAVQEAVSGAAETAKETVADAVEAAKDTTADAVEAVQETVSEAVEKATGDDEAEEEKQA